MRPPSSLLFLFLLYSRALFSYAAHAAHAAHAERTFKEIMVKPPHVPQSVLEDARKKTERIQAALRQFRFEGDGEDDACLAEYADCTRVEMRQRGSKGRDRKKWYPRYIVDTLGKPLIAPSQPQMLKKVIALVNSVRAEQVPLSVKAAAVAAEDDIPGSESSGSETESEEEDDDTGGFDDDMPDDSNDDAAPKPTGDAAAADDDMPVSESSGSETESEVEDEEEEDDAEGVDAAAAAAKQQRALKKLQSWKRKPAVFDDYKCGDLVEYTDPEDKIWMGRVEGIKTISDKAARTSGLKRVDVRFSDGSLGLAWPKHLTLVHRFSDNKIFNLV